MCGGDSIDDIRYTLLGAIEEARQQHDQLQSELADLEEFIERLEAEV